MAKNNHTQPQPGKDFHKAHLHAMENHARVLHDLRVYLRGFINGGGELGIQIPLDQLEDSLATAELTLKQYVQRYPKEAEALRAKMVNIAPQSN